MINRTSLFVFSAVCVLSSSPVLSQKESTDIQLIDEFINKKKKFNKVYGYGYRIQLYNGSEVEARKIIVKFRIEFPEIRTYLVYRQPEWKVQAGSYKTKLGADRALLEIKRKFFNSIVIPLGK